MNIDDIKNILPHRYPFLFVDKVIDIKENYIKAIKNVSINEYFFNGHFEKYPIMPGVLIIEGLAQTAGILLLKDYDSNVIPLFLGIEKVRFKNEVRPGDQITYEIEIINQKKQIFKVNAIASLSNKTCVEAILMLGMK